MKNIMSYKEFNEKLVITNSDKFDKKFLNLMKDTFKNSSDQEKILKVIEFLNGKISTIFKDDLTNKKKYLDLLNTENPIIPNIINVLNKCIKYTIDENEKSYLMQIRRWFKGKTALIVDDGKVGVENNINNNEEII